MLFADKSVLTDCVSDVACVYTHPAVLAAHIIQHKRVVAYNFKTTALITSDGKIECLGAHILVSQVLIPCFVSFLHKIIVFDRN